MYEPAASTTVEAGFALARVTAAADTISSAIAGFALLAGARAFMFFALLGWREPVLGGAGLLLLALVGWLRWQCGKENHRSAAGLCIAHSCTWPGHSATAARAGAAHESCTASFALIVGPDRRATLLATIGRSSPCGATAQHHRPTHDSIRCARVNCAQSALQRASPTRTTRDRSYQPHHQETPC
ncbi:hypothetical protein [Paraburkholderia sp. ZP32-5]|uniref:hypothetical protein n=1 Tax=Paraburkholderia sp. ZP32-5 TaxID=2883245 RepID=UPI001F3F29DC